MKEINKGGRDKEFLFCHLIANVNTPEINKMALNIKNL